MSNNLEHLELKLEKIIGILKKHAGKKLKWFFVTLWGGLTLKSHGPPPHHKIPVLGLDIVERRSSY